MKKGTLVRGSLSIVPLTFCYDTSLVLIQFLAVDGASFNITFGLPILLLPTGTAKPKFSNRSDEIEYEFKVSQRAKPPPWL